MSAYVDGDNRGEGKIRSENDWSDSAETYNGQSHRIEGHDNSDDDENAVVGDEARTDEIDCWFCSEFSSFADFLPDAELLFSKLLIQA